jgi:hypothetical protein
MAETVCVGCFEDVFLRRLLETQGTVSGEECEFCAATDKPCLPATRLADLFDDVIRKLCQPEHELDDYRQDDCKPIGDVLRDDLGTLNSDMDEPTELVRAVLEAKWQNRHHDDDYPDVTADWAVAGENWAASYRDALATLREEVRHLGHSFHLGPGKKIVVDKWNADHSYHTLKGALSKTEIFLDQGTTLYRARIDLPEPDRTRVEAFHAPPVSRTSAGRANLQGEPVWYFAREQETALAEVRPGRASDVSVAEFLSKDQLRLCGLDRRLRETSPFENIEKYEAEKSVAEIANTMGMMFARPVRPGDKDSDYLITQLLARMIREAGFDGIAYVSSQNRVGLNYLFFNPRLAFDFRCVRTFKCVAVTYSWRPA